MSKKLKTLWENLNVQIVVNQRELVLGVVACALAGILIGMFLSPKKRVAIGCHNGSDNVDNGNNNCAEPEELQFD